MILAHALNYKEAGTRHTCRALLSWKYGQSFKGQQKGRTLGYHIEYRKDWRV